ncbi:hypothetical protein AVEN_174024-1, partial [Araneus ventricosus]
MPASPHPPMYRAADMKTALTGKQRHGLR